MGQKLLLHRQLTSLAAAVKVCSGINGITSWVIVAAGTGYVVGELITLSGGTALIAATFRVAEVSAIGAVARLDILNAGTYTANTGAAAATTADKAGTGLTITATYRSDVPPDGCTHAVVKASSQAVSIRSDGTAPTAAIGNLLAVLTPLALIGQELRAAQVIEQTASAKLDIDFYRS